MEVEIVTFVVKGSAQLTVRYKLKKKTLRDNTGQLDYGYMCIDTDFQTKSNFLIPMKI